MSILLTIAQAGGAEPDPADWWTEADQRIEAIRKGDFMLTVTDPDGRPLSGQPLTVRQTRSHFLFGCAFGGDPTSDAPDEQRYRAWFARHFNALVHENDLKWYTVERQRDTLNYARADAILDWARRHDMAVRGHCLVWDREKWVHDWVLKVASDQGPDALRRELTDHITTTAGRYKGRLIAWDVANEILDGGWFERQLGPGTHAHMFRTAHAADPATPLFLNEYGILGNPEKTRRYLDLIRRLRARSAPVGGIGIQEHGAERILTDRARHKTRTAAAIDEVPLPHQITPAAINATLTALHDATGLPIDLTEVSARTDDPQRRADGLEALYRVGFAHRAVRCIMLWGFWEKRHFLGPGAALVDADWQPTAAGKRLEQLLLHEWRTTATVTTDPRGRATFRGFYGDYQITDATGRTLGTVRLTPDHLQAAITP